MADASFENAVTARFLLGNRHPRQPITAMKTAARRRRVGEDCRRIVRRREYRSNVALQSLLFGFVLYSLTARKIGSCGPISQVPDEQLNTLAWARSQGLELLSSALVRESAGKAPLDLFSRRYFIPWASNDHSVDKPEMVLLATDTGARVLHKHAQICTENRRETSCQMFEGHIL